MTAEIPTPLPLDVLERRVHLPLKPEPIALRGDFVRLEPVDVQRHLAELYAVSNGSPITLGGRSLGTYDADALIWRYLFGGPFASLKAFEGYVHAQVSAPNGLPFCVVDSATGQPIGMASYLNNAPEHLRIELGSIWYSPIAQRTAANTETTYLLLGHAFALGYRRVEWKCDARNERSRRAALRLGFQFEGVQQQHMIVKGHSRDTAWFRVLDGEWPGVQAHLEGLLRRGSGGDK